MLTILARKMTSWGFWGATATTALLLVALACSSGSSPTEPEAPLGDFSSNGSNTIAGPGSAPEDANIDIEKFTNGEDADLPPGPILEVGSAVEWAYVVTNTGDIDLVDIEVTDDQGVEVTCPTTVLAPDESMTCTASGVVEPVQYENLGLVEGFDDLANRYSDADPSHYLGADPAIDLEKYTNGEDADLPPGPEILVGDPVLWEYFVTNTGNVTLTDIAVTDDQGVVVDCPVDELAAGEGMTCTASGTAELGQYANLGTAVGTPPIGEDVTDNDPSHYFGVESLGDAAACGLGYWKNHLGAWTPTGYSPDQPVDSVFLNASLYGLEAYTLLEALEFGGGPGAEGGAMILLRHAVAALLNASHPEIDYPRTEGDVIADVDAALASGNRDAMLALKDELEFDNEAGCGLD